MNDKKYTMPRTGNTERGDEFLHIARDDRPTWMDVPEDSIGQPVEGWIIRRPVPIATGESALSDAMEIMKDIERQIAEIGMKFAIYREEPHGLCVDCIAGEPFKNSSLAVSGAPSSSARRKTWEEGQCPSDCRYSIQNALSSVAAPFCSKCYDKSQYLPGDTNHVVE